MGTAREPTSSRDLLGFGKRLRELRKARGLTQAELGGDRDTHAYISMIEAARSNLLRQCYTWGIAMEPSSGGPAQPVPGSPSFPEEPWGPLAWAC
jgi:hypothetical protein